MIVAPGTPAAPAIELHPDLRVSAFTIRIQALAPEEDPLRLREGEQAWTRGLTLAGPEFLPLRTFRDDDLLDTGSDPLLAVLGALGAVGSGERLLARLVVRSLGPEWSLQYHRRALVPALSPVLHPSYQYQTRPLKVEGIGLMLLMLPLLLGLQNYLWLRDGELLKAVLVDVAAVAGVAAASRGGAVARRQAQEPSDGPCTPHRQGGKAQ